MDTYNIVEVIKRKFGQMGSSARIPLLKGEKTFEARICEDGIYVDNLGTSPFLPWDAFIETVSLLERSGGSVPRGDAFNYKLGESGIPLNSVEGNIAYKVYNKQIGDSVFRRITPVACILIWLEKCMHEPGKLVLR